MDKWMNNLTPLLHLLAKVGATKKTYALHNAHPRSFIRALMSAKRIIGYYRMYKWIVKTQMILCICTG